MRQSELKANDVRHFVFPTCFGAMAVAWLPRGRGAGILRVFLPIPGASTMEIVKRSLPESRPGSCEAVEEIAGRIDACLNGSATSFSLSPALLQVCGAFQRRVLLAEHGVPRGSVTTYQRLASHVGQPTAARAVGMALARNPFPILIPCHRAIRSDGSLGGFQGGLEMKRALLAMEGVEFSPDGRVAAPRLHY